jgi:Fe-Mn family superoxide dismutase
MRSEIMITFPALPYADDALTAAISARTIGFHYGKHHRTYFEKLVKLIEDTPYANMELEDILRATAGRNDARAIFDNAAQMWNHSFYWQGLKKNGGGEPTGAVGERLRSSFGDPAAWRKELTDAAVNHFGSGWAWLILDGGKIKVTSTHDGENPLIHGQRPLLTLDVWEHAYYLDYQNRRVDYIAALLDKLVNWDFVAANLRG